MSGAFDVSCDLSQLDAALENVPNRPAVFLLHPREGEPYLAKTALLRRRLVRLLGKREAPSRLLNLRNTIARVQYWLSGSRLESSIRMYELARLHYPSRYADAIKLRMPPYVKIITANEFPRSQITTHIGRAPALYFGPFRTRSTAERFESEFLDLFQMRRCQEDLLTSPEHPGCIYGEMGKCLRPCQQAVGAEEYARETSRVTEFLRTGGHSLLAPAVAARDRLSEEMNFEEAAHQHRRIEKIQEVLKLRDELARDVAGLNGVAITASVEPNAAELWFFASGNWQPARRVSFEVEEGRPVSLDQKLKQTVMESGFRSTSARERQEYLAILARWYYSSWRDGEWLGFDDFEHLPYRRLVHAVSRVMSATPR